jgi:hypothetical protein
MDNSAPNDRGARGVASIRNATASLAIANSAGESGGVFAVDNSEMTIYGSDFDKTITLLKPMVEY